MHGTKPVHRRRPLLLIIGSFLATRSAHVAQYLVVLTSMPLISVARPNILLSPSLSLFKKIGKRRGPAEQVARQTRYPHVDVTGLASPEVNTMRQQLGLTTSKRRMEIECSHTRDCTLHYTFAAMLHAYVLALPRLARRSCIPRAKFCIRFC